MTGELDDAWPVAVQADMAARLGCEQVIIAGGAHSPAIDAPGGTIAALRAWLRD
jgi:pimeloyl-ACP methyl ester carboxylesterase